MKRWTYFFLGGGTLGISSWCMYVCVQYSRHESVRMQVLRESHRQFHNQRRRGSRLQAQELRQPAVGSHHGLPGQPPAAVYCLYLLQTIQCKNARSISANLARGLDLTEVGGPTNRWPRIKPFIFYFFVIIFYLLCLRDDDFVVAHFNFYSIMTHN